MRDIIVSMAVLGGLGLIAGILLGFAGRLLKGSEDEGYEAALKLIERQLPGYNCGGCGYPGCSELARAVLRGEAGLNDCRILRMKK